MIINKYIIRSFALLFMIGVSSVQASEIFVSTHVISTPIVPGDPALISITLSNDTGGQIRNVDLRLAGTEMMLEGNGVLQLGTMDLDGIDTVLAKLIPASEDGSLPVNIIWQVDYDVSSGNHARIEIGSELGMEE